MDAEKLVAEVNARTCADLKVIGLAEHGTVSGAAYVIWPDGHSGVVTRSPEPANSLEFTRGILDLARTRGALVPRYELIVELTDGCCIVQERLPGSPLEYVDGSTIDDIVAANDLFAHVLHDQPQVPHPQLHLRRSGPGYCLHETLARYDDRSRTILAWIRDVGRSSADLSTGDDLLHWDLVPGNILAIQTGDITGIVDWDGIGRGDRRFSLMKLRFNLEAVRACGYPHVTNSAISRLDDHLDVIPLDIDRPYWAHWSLSMLDWAIRHQSQGVVDIYLDLAGSRVG
ncbi:MAG TPA: phosphotransferase [Mycobacteriales bacterium]|nr:phosphotransferase [Mycobacteriales bacterium]